MIRADRRELSDESWIRHHPKRDLVAGARALAMSASSIWAGILRCSGTSPAFTIAGTPKGTASLRTLPHRAAAAARPRRRIDRIRSATSEFGTFKTCRL